MGVRAVMKHQSALPLAPEARSNFPSQRCKGHSRSEIVSFQSVGKRVLISALYFGIIQQNHLYTAAPFYLTKMKWRALYWFRQKILFLFFFMSDWAESKNNAFGLLAYIFPNKKTQKDKMRCQSKIVPNLQWVKNAKLSWLHLYWKLAGNAWWCITQKRKCAPPVPSSPFRGFSKTCWTLTCANK